MSSEKLDLIETEGDPFQIGTQHGEALRKEINDFLRFLYIEFAYGDLQLENARKFAQKFARPLENFSKEATLEMRGIARGAHVDYEDIILIALSEEIPSFSHACTAFAATGQATRDSHTFLGQTWDNSVIWCENVEARLIRKKYKGGPTVLAYIFPGMIAAAGLNSQGIGISWNTVPKLRLNEGVPTYVIINKLLKQKTIAEAISVVRDANRAGCFNFIVANDKEIYNIEATPDDVEIDYTNSYYGHTNHYVGDKFSGLQNLSQEQTYSSAAVSTLIRQERLLKMMEDKYSYIELEDAMDFLRDHVNYPDSICSHPNFARKKENRNMTRSGWVMIPYELEWWITPGLPCQKRYYCYSVESKGLDEFN